MRQGIASLMVPGGSFQNRVEQVGQMSGCPYVRECGLPAGLEGLSKSMAAAYQQAYCQSECQQCARYRAGVELGWQYVPESLLPIEMERAERIIEAIKLKWAKS